MGEEVETLYMPPPKLLAEFPEKVVLEMLGEEAALYMPPPLVVAEFPEKVVLEMLGKEVALYMPPPLEAEFPEKVVLEMLGEEEALYMPPPPFERIFSEPIVRLLPRLLNPLVMVKPSSAAVVKPMVMTTL